MPKWSQAQNPGGSCDAVPLVDVGLPKAKTPDNRAKWQVIYHIQPFLAGYSCFSQLLRHASCFCTKDFQATEWWWCLFFSRLKNLHNSKVTPINAIKFHKCLNELFWLSTHNFPTTSWVDISRKLDFAQGTLTSELWGEFSLFNSFERVNY